ncbi:hypothetical protein GGR92_003146 [Spirosoma lacussanchae]|uniref:FAD-dependent oxidoreductase n=1 Tax=Spirosoma lacussanchae TaxID=1884249 RepID=UPI001107EE66|nr:FAD-dependent oxidoreductase [Spirosoma lacussanchae]
MPTRRFFLHQTGLGLAGLLAGPWALESCRSTTAPIPIKGQLRGANQAVGHLLRGGTAFPAPTHEQHLDVLIIGGGIAGLSARRWLHRQGLSNTLLVELDEQTGGNSSHGQNAVSAYPWGAHYLPVPDPRNTELIDFLREVGTITGLADQGQPIYNEYHLCHDPQERLLIDGHWQEGLVPERGVPASDRAQLARFFALIDTLKQATGQDGRDAFAIPLDRSSADPTFRALDTISFADYLDQHGYTSPYLRWYLSYACRDDYGATPETVSAWAGLHYFAARKGKGRTQTGGLVAASDVLTWPQGNGFLLDHLRQSVDSPPEQPNLLTHHLAHAIQPHEHGVRVLCYNVAAKRTIAIQAKAVLLATPQVVTKSLLRPLAPDRAAFADQVHSAPWLVANLTVNSLPQGGGMPLCWDNVGYNTASVGYITANHQDVSDQPKRVITLYWPLTDAPPHEARQRAYRLTYADWVHRVLTELEALHPGVTPSVEQIDVQVWGHGMVAPTPGFVWGEARQQAMRSIGNQLFFAHSDLSGISLFEEAFYQGIRAAREIIQALHPSTHPV